MKKKILFHFVLLFILASCNAFATDDVTLIFGRVNKQEAESIHLFSVIEGKKVELATSKISSGNNFKFKLTSVKEGFYYLSDQNKKYFTRIYLKPQEKLELKLGEDSYKIKSGGSPENKILYNWFTEAYPVMNPVANWIKDTSTYVQYFPKLNALLPKISAFRATINTPNNHFNDLMNMAVDIDVENAALTYLLIPRSVHPTSAQYPEYYKGIIQPKKYKNTNLLEFGDGVDLLNKYCTFYSILNLKPTDTIPNWLQFTTNLLGNDTLKGALVANSLRFTNYEALEKAIEPVKQYLLTDSMQAAYARAVKNLTKLRKGSQGYNFSYEDITGKKVSLSDLKGKVVLVDIWATWCRPCRAQIPYLKKLEEEFAGKDIEFVSITIDDIKDKEKWKNLVAKDNMGGIQLFAGTKSDIAAYYNISSIPRFMVFDKDGKIVTVEAPYPSAPELKQILESKL